MAETLFIRLAGDGVATWAVFESTGRLLTAVARGTPDQARSLLAGRRVAVLVPAGDVTTATADLPVASQSRLRQIVPFSLEESLADDVEEMTFAIGARLESGATLVSAVAKRRLDAWLEELARVGIVPNRVYSEADGVPDIPNTLVLLLDGTRIIGRNPGAAPFVLDGFTIREALEIAGGPTPNHALVYLDGVAKAEFGPELAALGEELAGLEVKVAGDGLFAHLAATLAQRGGTNLLQGTYAPKSNWGALLRPWRLAASLLVASAALALALQGVRYWQLLRTDDALTALVAASCQRLVGDSRVSACQREVQQRGGNNAAGGGAEDFLSTLAAVAAARDPELRIDALSYRNQTMNLQLVARSVPALDEFARGLEQTRRFDAEIEAANQSDAGTEGRVRIVGVNP